MSTETFTVPCRPQTLRQVEECVPPADGNAHAKHQNLTELALFSCNCGYSSGWMPVDRLPSAVDFIRLHGGAEALESIGA